MRIVFLGTGEFGVAALRALRVAGHEIVAAVSQPDRPAKRGLKVHPTPIHAAADSLGISHVQTEDVNRLDAADVIREAALGVVVAFGQKIGPAILGGLPKGCVNIHASLLPRYRGAAPYQWAVINGDATTGVTVFQLNERWDAGEIWSQRETPIGETETAAELHDRLAVIGAELIVETVAGIEHGTARARPQDASRASRAPKLSRADGVVDWSQPAETIARRIHGLWSWPGAACMFVSHTGKSERVVLARARVADGRGEPDAECAAGAVREDFTVQTGRGRLQLLEIKPAGGKLMSFEAFANGRRVQPHDRFCPLEAP